MATVSHRSRVYLRDPGARTHPLTDCFADPLRSASRAIAAVLLTLVVFVILVVVMAQGGWFSDQEVSSGRDPPGIVAEGSQAP